MKYFLTIITFCLFTLSTWAQPINDDCSGLIDLGIAPVCSDDIYTNIDATPSNIGFDNIPTCFNAGDFSKDVFFAFTVDPAFSDLTITITGTTLGSNGISIVNPEVALYRGTCMSDGLSELLCTSSGLSGDTVACINFLELIPGLQYFLRIKSATNSGVPNWGDFKVCIKEYNPDYNALMALYDSTDGPNWTNNTGWIDGAAGNNCDPCTWYGITCDQNNRVTCIDLDGSLNCGVSSAGGNNLIGNLPEEIGDLDQLQFLYIRENNLGVLPSGLGSLLNLTALDLYNCQLTGNIPSSLGNLSSLDLLGLGTNQLYGSIPAELGQLNNCRFFYLASNQLTGSIPSSLGNLSSVRSFWLNNNLLSGNIPSELGDLPQVSCFRLYDNQLTGTIPAELGNITTFTCFELNDNNLEGCLPENLKNICSYLPGGNGDISNNPLLDSPIWSSFCNFDSGQCPVCPTGTTITVTSNADDGPGTLRRAIECANADPLLDTIWISPQLSSIQLESALPSISDNGIFLSADSQREPSEYVGINGSNLNVIESGLRILSDSVTVKGFLITNFPSNGIHITTARNVLIDSNYISLNGRLVAIGSGIRVTSSEIITLSNNLIESQLDNGISMTTVDTFSILNNICAQNEGVGLELVSCDYGDIDNNQFGNGGTGNLSGEGGIKMTSTTNINIGINNGNTIVNNAGPGIQVSGENIQIENNWIGTYDIGGNAGNMGPGIIAQSTGLNVSNNTIAYNGEGGIIFHSSSENAKVSQNQLFCNDVVGIDINSSVAIPLITLGSPSFITGQATPNTKVEVFQLNNNDCTNNTICQGYNYLGIALADNQGDWSLTPSMNLLVGDEIIAFAFSLDELESSGGSNCFVITDVCTHPDFDALIALFNSTNGLSWTNKMGWMDGAAGNNCDPCSWYGVTCNENGRVICLDLDGNATCGQPESNNPGNGLTGTIPNEFGDLLFLEKVDFSNNDLSGSIPNSIGNLVNLQVLSCANNNISGSLPSEMGALSNLYYLSLNGNEISENIPAQLGNLISLEEIYLENNLLNGSIPSSLSDLTSLSVLALSNNQLTGTIPPEISNIAGLGYLSLFSNNLSGSIPVELGNLSNLRSLALHDNQLSGSIPTTLSNLSLLETLNLGTNLLEGPIPTTIGNLSNLQGLYLDNNNLNGTIPATLANLNNLTDLYLQNNQLEGCFPSELSVFCTPTPISYNFMNNPALPGGGDFDAFCQNGTGACSVCPMGTSITVTSNADDGAGTLRQAIDCVNADPVLDTILIAPFIDELILLSPLPDLTDDGIYLNALAERTTIPYFIINGINLGAGINGMISNNANNITIKGFYVTNFPDDGIVINGGQQITLDSNHLVLNGRLDSQGEGIHLRNNTNNTTISNNVFDANAGDGIDINDSSNFTIKDNQIANSGRFAISLFNSTGGTIDANEMGTRSGIPISQGGLQIQNSSNLSIGRNNANTIINNIGPGILMDGSTSTNIQIENNFIGTTIENISLGNTGIGIQTTGAAQDITIITNTIANNIGGGIAIGNASHRVAISQNSLFCNENFGISIAANANTTPSIPSIIQAEPTLITGTATPNTSVEVFVLNNLACPENMVCQGASNLGTATADTQGNWSLSPSLNLTNASKVLAIGFSTDGLESSEASSCVEVIEACTHPDYDALMALYNSTDGENWTNNGTNITPQSTTEGWGRDCDPCSWYGIECNADGRVSCIDLDGDNSCTADGAGGNNLSGIIPLEFDHLIFLQRLYLRQNNLTGTIPDFTNLPRLESFSCSANELTGEIRDFTNLPALESYSCSGNSLTGSIPDFMNLPNLEGFYCNSNELTGKIPVFSNLPNLNQLRCRDNQLSGCFPDYVCTLDVFDATNNPLLPWQGDHTQFCAGEDQIGAVCNDENPNTLIEIIQDDCECRSICNRQRDSLALVDFYMTTNGASWNIGWNLNTPIDQWHGITLTSEGCVQCLDLDGLDDCDESASQGGNGLSGTLPNSLGNLSSLEKIYLTDNPVSGNIPASFYDLIYLKEVYFDNLDLEGGFSSELSRLENIQILLIDNNQFTFEDILPAITSINAIISHDYAPQDSVYQTETHTVTEGDDLMINLNIDNAILNNNYQWYKNDIIWNGSLAPNALNFTNIQLSDAGDYYTKITNPDVPDLTLISRTITINVLEACLLSNNFTLDTDICSQNTGIATAEVLGGSGNYTYEWSNGNPNTNTATNLAAGEYYLTITDAACILTDTFTILAENSVAFSTLSNTLCFNESRNINGVIYDINNPAGTETLIGGATNGCDSIVTINLSFYEEATSELDTIICTGESIVLDNLTYTDAVDHLPILLTTPSQNGCDSILILTLSYYDIAPTIQQATICSGESYHFFGTELTTTGHYENTLSNSDGCDSIIALDLVVNPALGSTIAAEICAGESYDFFGTELTTAGHYESILTSSQGCDSLITLDLVISSVLESTITTEICPDEPFDFCGEFYTEAGNYPCLMESVSGCDSIVTLELRHRIPFTIMTEPDAYDFSRLAEELFFNITNNDLIEGDFELQLITPPLSGTLELMNASFRFQPDGFYVGLDSFSYAVCTQECQTVCDTSWVFLNITSDCLAEIIVKAPTAFSPNDDGLNDLFDPISFLGEGCDYDLDQIEIVIINRASETIFRQKPYQPWTGKGIRGRDLPADTYFYLLFYEGEKVRGPIMIVR